MSDPFGFAAAINWDVVDKHADEIAAIFDKPKACKGCGSTDSNLSGTEKCPKCVAVDVHNYRALHDGRMKTREYAR